MSNFSQILFFYPNAGIVRVKELNLTLIWFDSQHLAQEQDWSVVFLNFAPENLAFKKAVGYNVTNHIQFLSLGYRTILTIKGTIGD